MSSPKKVYWDTCAFLALLNEEDGRVDVLKQIYERAQRGEFEIWTSTLTLAECRRLKSEEHDTKPLSEENLATIKALFRQDCMKIISLNTEIAETSRSILRKTSGLGKWQDAVHLASALQASIGTMHTYDADDLLHLNMSLLCRDGTTTLKIEEPTLTGQTIELLFDDAEE